jgi:hypothetical protein
MYHHHESSYAPGGRRYLEVPLTSPRSPGLERGLMMDVDALRCICKAGIAEMSLYNVLVQNFTSTPI